jgi:hypothetical protein
MKTTRIVRQQLFQNLDDQGLILSRVLHNAKEFDFMSVAHRSCQLLIVEAPSSVCDP